MVRCIKHGQDQSRNADARIALMDGVSHPKLGVFEGCRRLHQIRANGTRHNYATIKTPGFAQESNGMQRNAIINVYYSTTSIFSPLTAQRTDRLVQPHQLFVVIQPGLDFGQCHRA